jgi:hypothetical protein
VVVVEVVMKLIHNHQNMVQVVPDLDHLQEFLILLHILAQDLVDLQLKLGVLPFKIVDLEVVEEVSNLVIGIVVLVVPE